MPLPTVEAIRDLLLQRKRATRDVIRAFARGMQDGDVEATAASISTICDHGAWRPAMAACARLKSVHPKSRDAFVKVWCESGDSIRSEVNDDRTLFAALRILLPPYTGPAVILYRGDSAWNRRRRSYGASWSTSREVAEEFARGEWMRCVGGSVLLRTVAPPEAIICAPAIIANGYEEDEYLVDRRRLGIVEVIDRFGELSPVAP